MNTDHRFTPLRSQDDLDPQTDRDTGRGVTIITIGIMSVLVVFIVLALVL